jgi:hypothetical protein
MLKNIASVRSRALALAEQNKKYSALLKHLLAKDIFYDENESIPFLKQLSETSGINYSKLESL